MTEKSYAHYIDHTLLKAEATKEQIIQLCEEAKIHQFASVCVNPHWVQVCAEILKGTNVKVCTVIGFPLGVTSTQTKAFETEQAIAHGATEVDMVINIGALKDQNDNAVQQDIAAVVQAASGKALVKVIIETSLLTEEEKIRACELSKQAGADFVKTSTGFSTGGATVEDIKLMRSTVGSEMGVKASGGVRNRQAAIDMIEAGATRIGTSNGIAIVSGEGSGAGY
ncbi:deoxyribose-phosphate aldolase [Bacillus horti]|uniref:Deoxyribose-phosphate aldolase n=1 Tax=Caldalkalibacillus horti TaxID=77523 RepID=A0ABT9W473_9BACI|nr:deoxyribose-phosphate aldolase [Bacillus horti]MDQ0168038.1 deoxyribose-phosphate aldolase [Bacillus horti]